MPTSVSGMEEERQDLTTALGLVKELLSNVDQDVHELEKGARLQEIYNRMDPRAQAPVPGKGPFGREELLRRKLIHDGCLLWKTATGRFKGQWTAWQTRQESMARGKSLQAHRTSFNVALVRPSGRKICELCCNKSQNSGFNFMGDTRTSLSGFVHSFGPCVPRKLPILMRKTEKFQD